MRLAFTGDISFNNVVSDDAFSRIAPQLPCPLFVNFESVLVASESPGAPVRDKVVLWSPSRRFRLLEAFDVAAVCLSNNHIGDYGNDVARHTIKTSEAKHETFGAGAAGEFFHRLRIERDGSSLAFLAYCLGDASPLHATHTRIGPRDFKEEAWREDLDWGRASAHHVIVVLHWGDVHTHCPRPDQVLFARSLIDAGADLVVGSHSHTVQGYECYRNKYIFYSLGNFFFPDVRCVANDRLIIKRNLRRNQWGLIPIFDFRLGGITLTELSIVHRTGRRPERSEKRRFRKQIERCCRWLKAPDLEAVCLAVRQSERRRKRMEERWLRNREVPNPRHAL